MCGVREDAAGAATGAGVHDDAAGAATGAGGGAGGSSAAGATGAGGADGKGGALGSGGVFSTVTEAALVVLSPEESVAVAVHVILSPTSISEAVTV